MNLRNSCRRVGERLWRNATPRKSAVSFDRVSDDCGYRTDFLQPRCDCIELMSWWEWQDAGPWGVPIDQAAAELGGLLGLALGATASALLARYAGWQTVVTSGSALMAFGFSAAVGVKLWESDNPKAWIPALGAKAQYSRVRGEESLVFSIGTTF